MERMLSIIIVTLGDTDLLRECLSSIREHVELPREVILVNNSASTLPPSTEPGVICLENGRNMGFARGVNRGIRAASGDKILLLNPDARFTSDIATEMAAFLDAHEKAGIAGPQLVFPDGSLQNSIDVIPNLATETLNKSLLKRLFPRAYPSKRTRFEGPVQVPSVIGACMMVKRRVIDTVGPLDEGFFLYLEETDLCARAALAGFEVWLLPQLTLVHHQGATAHQYDFRRKTEYQRSLYRFFRKNRGTLQAALLFAFSLVKLTVEALGGIPASVTKKGRLRLKRSLVLLAWSLAGMPGGWGLEGSLPPHARVRRNGCTWFLPPGAGFPGEVADIEAFMETFGDTVLNRSRTTFVKSGRLGDKDIFLKRYNYKGLKDTVKNLFRKSRARRAFEGALMLDAGGIATPPVLFACEKRVCGVLLASYVATLKVDARDLVAHVAENGWDAALVAETARFVRRLHEMGFIPVDLKGENLLKSRDAILLIDLDRLRRPGTPGLSPAARNLSYLNASFCRTVPHHDRLFFLDEYMKGNPRLEGRREELAARIKVLTEKRLRERYP
jgi:GT2 family glycosyltransferase/tRNA A-37 threonylcarbamoyl transferase component Bud32